MLPIFTGQGGKNNGSTGPHLLFSKYIIFPSQIPLKPACFGGCVPRAGPLGDDIKIVLDND